MKRALPSTMRNSVRHRGCLLLFILGTTLLAPFSQAQQLQTKFGCNMTRDEDGEKVIYGDTGEFKLDGERIVALHWESALYRPTHGFECSIDTGDDPQAEVAQDGSKENWRITLKDPVAARHQRGYDFYNHGMNCSIRLQRDGDKLHVIPSCPALCGSRGNFTELSVDLKTGECSYEQK
ncbi:hypothetical protein CAter282_4244 [Collimonas arenae]|uniref:Lipoprotein n=1 Tax=Collimonas arenae TaxID=279058 RepID=A0A127PW16_9BURK|nr:hypothetical protein [Collimonas arenae]AMP02008.1 hypothetical protein CAter10_4618 [Collimonas arenae]AMP11904.1 hypothetical protein CAter282_4244 [Collimonas arenae]